MRMNRLQRHCLLELRTCEWYILLDDPNGDLLNESKFVLDFPGSIATQ